MKIWIFGDSFSANTDSNSWTNLLDGNVTTEAFNGSSEYRIWRTYQDNKHLINSTDRVIFCHTSSNRVFLQDDVGSISRHLDTHPVCDLLFNNVYSNNETQFINVLETIWDDRYFKDNYDLLVSDLKSVKNSTHITFFESDTIDSLHSIWKEHPGDINHMTPIGNYYVSKHITNRMTNIKRIVSFGASMTAGQGLDDPKQSYPYVLANRLNCEIDNVATPGASNLEILHNILTYKFIEGDTALLMWAPCNRDLLFNKNKLESIGAWQDTELTKNWALTHSESDLTVRTWYHIQHAILFLNRLGIGCINFAGYARPLEMHRPSYITDVLHDSGIDTYKRHTQNCSDGHPGPEAHKLIANRILSIIK